MKVIHMNIMKVALIGSALLSLAAIAAESIEDRIAPVGDTCMAGEDCAAAVAAPAAGGGAAEARSGEVVYSTCAACHDTGASGAPKLGDVAAWEPRVAKGIDVLHDHAINGFNAMPAKGLCFDCSDEEIAAAVDYMVENSQ